MYGDDDVQRMLENQLEALIHKAKSFGFVLTVETVPIGHAMGSYEMRGYVRPGPAMRKARAAAAASREAPKG